SEVIDDEAPPKAELPEDSDCRICRRRRGRALRRPGVPERERGRTRSGIRSIEEGLLPAPAPPLVGSGRLEPDADADGEADAVDEGPLPVFARLALRTPREGPLSRPARLALRTPDEGPRPVFARRALCASGFRNRDPHSGNRQQ